MSKSIYGDAFDWKNTRIDPVPPGGRITGGTKIQHATPQLSPDGQTNRLAELVAMAIGLRNQNMSVGMLDADGRLIEFVNDFGENQTWSRGGFHRVFGMPNVASLAIPTSAVIFLDGPIDDFDATGKPKFPETLRFHSGDRISRLFAAPDSLGSGYREARFERWVLRSGLDFVDALAGELHFPHGAEPIAQAPVAFIDALIGSSR